jgi:hypothetical protein
VADVDGDGKDEIIYGSCTIDDNGTGLYNTGLDHGDALHVGDLDPSRPGLEVWAIHEPAGDTVIGSSFRDAATGEVLWSVTPGDVGRGVADDIYAGNPGAEMWSSNTGNLRDSAGNNIGRSPGSTNFLAWWDADLTRELLDSNHIDKYGTSSDTRLLTATDCSSNNGTKSTPALSADLFGDWREEVIWRTSDNAYLRIYTTTTPATGRIYTLMHDPQYRESIAWQNTAYNQPPHTSFYLGDGMAAPPTPNIYYVIPGPSNPTPTVVNPASASPSVITDKTTNLSVLGDDDGGEANLTYAWSATGPVAVAFSTNGSNASKNTVATFAAAGSYTIIARIIDANGGMATSFVNVTVNQTLSGLAINPAPVSVNTNMSIPFAALAIDQFGNSLSVQPTFTWSIVSGGGSINSSTGVYTAPSTAGSAVVRATSGSVNITANVTIQTTTLFPSYADIGSPALAGSNSFSNPTYSLDGTGIDIWGTSDQFRYVYKAISGNATIIARVISVENTDLWAKGGVMIRETLAADSKNAYVAVTPGNGVTFQRRYDTAGTSSSTKIAGIVAPYWVKLVRNGNDFSDYCSADGLAWTQVGATQTISMASTVYIGLAVTSHDAADICTSTFDNVSVGNLVSNAAPTVAVAASATPNSVPLNTTTNLSVLGADSGGETNLTYTWAAVGTPPAPVVFSINGSNAAKNTTATFSQPGSYNLRVTITDAGGLTVTSFVNVNVMSPASIAGRMIFYNNSKFDAHTGYPNGDPAVNQYDSVAIAFDKTALLPGETASFVNYTSYSRGINGIMVDIAGAHGAITADDFMFKVGNDNDPGNWTLAPAPINFIVQARGGAGGTDRVTVTWGDNDIVNQWLQVTVLANANTKITGNDVFYFGNTIGESCDNQTNAVVNFDDELGSRIHKSGFAVVAIDNFYDYNRDGKVNSTDDLIARRNTAGPALQLIAPPVGGALAASDALQPLAADAILPVPMAPAIITLTQSETIASAPTLSGLHALSMLPASTLANRSLPLVPEVFDLPKIFVPRETLRQSSAVRHEIAENFKTISPQHINIARYNPALVRDRLHDAVFTQSDARRSPAEDCLSENSTLPVDIETILNENLSGKAEKSYTHVIDNVITALRHRTELR